MSAVKTMARGRSTMFGSLPTAEELLRECFPDLELPILSIGTIFLTNDSVAVSGSVSPDVASAAELMINGHYVPITEWGNFCTTVRLQGQLGLTLSLETETHPLVTLDVPLKAMILESAGLKATG